MRWPNPIELITDERGRLCSARAGFLIAGLVYTAKMVISLPDDPWMWGIYMATVGGVAAARDIVQARFSGGFAAAPQPHGAPAPPPTYYVRGQGDAP